MAVFLTVYTPTSRRPTMLAACQASVRWHAERSKHVVEHVIWVDDVGLGIANMFAAIPEQLHNMKGEYVYVLQDDDQLSCGRAQIDGLAHFVAGNGNPPVVICRNRKRNTIYPPMELWQKRPQIGQIDLGSYIIRKDVFAAHAGDFGHHYAGDFDFIDALWRYGYPFAWWNRNIVFSEEQLLGVPGLGRAEQELKNG